MSVVESIFVAMDAESSDTKLEIGNASTSLENVDVEMNLSATVLTKAEPPKIDRNHDGADKKRAKKKKAKQTSPNTPKKPKKDPNKPEYPKVGEYHWLTWKSKRPSTSIFSIFSFLNNFH